MAGLLLKFLYNTGAGKSLLEIVYNRFRSFRFFVRSFRFFFVAALCSSPPRPGRRGQIDICVPWPKLPLESAHWGLGIASLSPLRGAHAVCSLAPRYQPLGPVRPRFGASCCATGPCLSTISRLRYFFLKAPRLSEAMCRRKECRGACGGSLNGGDRSGEAQLRELGHTCPDERSRAAAVSGNRSLIYICGSVCLYRFS